MKYEFNEASYDMVIIDDTYGSRKFSDATLMQKMASEVIHKYNKHDSQNNYSK